MTDVIDRLEALGRAPVPHLDEDRLQAMEARVLHATHHRTDEHRRRTLVLAVAAAVVLLVAGVVFASGGNGTVRLEVADGVILERPGVGADVGAAGDELPDGTRVEVRPGGQAVVDGERYGPGRYVVVDGRLEPVGGPPSISTTTTSMGATADGAGPPIRVTAPSTQPDPVVPRRRPTTTVISTTTAGPTDVETTIPAAGDRQPVVDRPTTTVAGERRPVPVTTIGSTTIPVDRAPTTATDRTTTTAGERPTTTTSRSTTTTTTSAPPDRRGSDRP